MLQRDATREVNVVRPPEFSRAERVRVLIAAACGSVVVGYAAVAALLALIAATATHAAFSTGGVLTAAAPAWLAAHHVPLRFDAGQLGVLPLLPTALLMLLVGRTAAGTADRLGLYEPLQARGVVLSISAAHAVVGGTIALLMGDGVVRATPAVAFFGCAAVSGVAATLGVARRCGLVEVVFERLDPVALQGVRAGFMALFALVSAGALMVAAGLAASWPTTSGLFTEAGPSFGVGLGVWLMCLGYLPNAIIAGLSYVTGAGFSIGMVEVTPMRFEGGQVPAVPLLAAMPEGEFALSPLVLALAALIGAFAGWCCRKVSDRPTSRIRAVLVAAITVGVGTLVLAATAGGRLAAGAFDPVTVPAGLLALLSAMWVLVPGALVAWLAGSRTKAVTEAVDAEPDLDDEIDEDENADAVTEQVPLLELDDDEDDDPAEEDPAEVVDDEEFLDEEIADHVDGEDEYDEDEYDDEYSEEDDELGEDEEDEDDAEEEPEEDLDAEFDEMLGMESEDELAVQVELDTELDSNERHETRDLDGKPER